MSPQISVIIPAYNAERTILETIASAQQQTFSDFELIVINDGSTDGTLELLNSVEDPRLKIFSYSNGGLPVARNRGISQASGEFITFLDADDLWTPDKLEAQVAALQQHPEAGLAYSWTYFMDDKGESFHTSNTVTFEGNVYSNLLLGNFLESGSNPLIRRQAIDTVGEFDSTLKYCEDWEYWLRLAARWPFVVVPKQQIFYRQTSGAMSSNIEVAEKYHLIFIERAFQSAPLESRSLKNQSLANIYEFLAQLYLTRLPGVSGAKLARQKLQTAIAMYPQILFKKKTQSLVFKLVLIRVLSPNIASNLLQFISKIRATRIKNSHNDKALLSKDNFSAL
ncbi:glycosyltransferase family 2 protein [Nostoc sp. LEGE 12450]|uniref:glycosyltransferase family 2 protein n=1 Tax=Nostoc sp. LEGE 12450 TaxID=1828643 RepID=UPI001882CC1C|nr:glycosyltransferase [Nostoc sp. LEGE 12450]MBE8991538.1 glycosyltransferase [Nostoc sp. LEGE 12450]